MTIEELIEEAKKRYPIGTSFLPVSYGGEVSRVDGPNKVKGDRMGKWVNPSFPKEAQAIHENSSSGLLYAFGIWAPIVEKGDEYTMTEYQIY